jgi:hypothetical protein
MSEVLIEMPKVPKKVFIVPYRNRIQQKFFFSKYMSFILDDKDDYEIYFSHQCDARTFNRGATKNIGFIAIKNKYPNDYKNMTIIFNDVDTIPFHKIFDYETMPGIVKHYYGFTYALGGIVVIKGADFEKINGYPCFWGWGMEDNVLQKRCEAVGIKIDRSVFYKIGSAEILQLFDGISRIISKKDPWRGEYDNGVDGIRTINKLFYNIANKSENPNDNIYVVNNNKIFYINISTFLTYIPFEHEEHYTYDLREPKREIINPKKIKSLKKKVSTTQDWTNIPYYPTTSEKRVNLAKHLQSVGKPVSDDLRRQITEDNKKENETDSFNNLNVSNLNKVDENETIQNPYPTHTRNQYPYPTHTRNLNSDPTQTRNQNPYPTHTRNQNPHPTQTRNPYPTHTRNPYPTQTRIPNTLYDERLNYFHPYNMTSKSRISLGGINYF